MLMSTAVELFLTTKRLEGYSPFTLNGYTLIYRIFIRDIGDLNIDEIKLEHFRTHLSMHQELKPSSLGGKVRGLKSLFKWLHEEDYIIKNPTLKLKEPKQPKRVPKALNTDELELLRDSCKNTLEHALIELFFSTGCRVGEIYRINKNDVDWNRKSILVLGKGNKEREVYFGSRAAIWLKRYLNERKDNDPALIVTQNAPHRMPTHQIQWVFKRIAKRCNLEHKVSPHVLRHTLATTLLNQGAPLVAVQSILGHEKPETTELYLNLSGENRQRAYRQYFIQ